MLVCINVEVIVRFNIKHDELVEFIFSKALVYIPSAKTKVCTFDVGYAVVLVIVSNDHHERNFLLR